MFFVDIPAANDLNGLRYALAIFQGIILYISRLERPRLRSNESPSGAFKRQSGLRKQMEGLCPDKLCGALQTHFHKRGHPLSRYATAPPRGRLLALPQSFPPPLKPSPWGRWIAAKRQDGRGNPAVYRCGPSREKAILENPQIFQNCKYKNIFSADDAQSERGAHSQSSRAKGAYFTTLANSAARAAFTERMALASGLMAVRS